LGGEKKKAEYREKVVLILKEFMELPAGELEGQAKERSCESP